MEYYSLMGFGPNGWGHDMMTALVMTIAVSTVGFTCGIIFGCIGAAASRSHSAILRASAEFYTTIFRGIPDLLIIYLFYFGSSTAILMVASLFGAEGFVGAPAFITGALAIGAISGAYQTKVFVGAIEALSRGEIEAARACGMQPFLLFRRIVLPQAMRFAIPGIGNVWQLVLKESALISVIGLVEIMRQAQIGAGSTRQPFSFFLAAAFLYLTVTFISGVGFKALESRAMRGIRRNS